MSPIPLSGAAARRRRRAREFQLELVCAVAARRRRLVAAALLDLSPGQGPQGPKPAPAATFDWAAHVHRMTESMFKLRYRLTADAFYHLLDEKGLRAQIALSPKAAKKATRAKWMVEVPAEVKLAMCLRYLAGGDTQDLWLIYCVDRSYVYKCIWLVVDGINALLVVDFPLHDVSKLRKLEAEFRAASRGGIWQGQVGAIDGVHFEMEAPTLKDVSNPMKYYVERKHGFFLLCIAVCDAQRRFLFFDISQVPTTHDSLAWGVTDLGVRIANGELPAPFFLNGDAAFALSPSMVTPSGDPALDDYDYFQSSNRMPIECTFGILVRRFGVLYKKIKVRFDRRAHLVAACMRLHNYCIDMRIQDETRDKGGISMVCPGRWELTPVFDRDGRPVEYLDIERGPRQRVRANDNSDRTSTRTRLVQLIQDAGLHRPVLPAGVARRQKRKRGARGARGVARARAA